MGCVSYKKSSCMVMWLTSVLKQTTLENKQRERMNRKKVIMRK